MLKYESLSKGQKRMVDAFCEIHPELLKTQTITFGQCLQLFNELYEKRVEGTPKIGFPNWLLRHNRVGRGVYWFPHSHQDKLAHKVAAKKATKVAAKSTAKKSAKKTAEAPTAKAAKRNGKKTKQVEHSAS
jgi:hypothetical protein